MTETGSYLLSAAEVRALTGAVRRAKQLGWLIARGVRAELGADNQVKVLRAEADRLMLAGGKRSAPVARGPNLAALRKTG